MRHLLTLTNAGAMFPPTSLDTVNLLVEAFFWLIAIALFLQTLVLWHKTGAPHPLVCPAQVPFPRDGDSEVERSAPTHPPWRHDAGIVKFFKSFWNLADLVNYSLFMAILGCRIYTLTLLNELDFQPPSSPSRPIELDAGWLRLKSPHPPLHADVFSDFHLTAIGLYQVSNLMAVTCVITWFKLLRFLQLSSRLSQASWHLFFNPGSRMPQNVPSRSCRGSSPTRSGPPRKTWARSC